MIKFFQRFTSVGGGYIAYTLSALQTTLLSVFVANVESKETLAVFSFLLSIYYFTSQLLRHSHVEPILSNQYQTKRTQIRRFVSNIIFTASIFLITALFTQNWEIAITLFFANIVFFFWILHKNSLRINGIFLIYTIEEFILLLIVSGFLILSYFEIQIKAFIVILIYASLQISFLLINQFFIDLNALQSANVKEEKSINFEVKVHLSGDYFFFLGLVLSNLYLLWVGEGTDLGEVRGVFLILAASTFSIGALRNAIFSSRLFSKVSFSLLTIFFFNIIFAFFISPKLLTKYVPVLPDNFKSVLVPVSIDICSSLIFMIMSVRCIFQGKFFLISLSKFGAFFILCILFILNRKSSFSSVLIAWLYCCSSLFGSIFLFLTIFGLQWWKSRTLKMGDRFE